MEMFKEIQEIKGYMSETIQSNENLALIASVNYIENIFGLTVVNSKEDSDLLIVAESKKYKGLMFEFVGETYKINSYHCIRGTYLILDKIIFGDQQLEIKKGYYLTKNNLERNKISHYFNKPFKEILEFKVEDEEQNFVINLLKTSLDEMGIEYEYKEEIEGETDTFLMILENLKISFGFSNTVQFSFEKNMNSIQLVYREKSQDSIESELDEILQFVKMYLGNITLENHNISELYDGLMDIVGNCNLCTSIFLRKGKPASQPQPLFTSFVIGETFETEFKQIELSVDFDFHKKTFILNVNYLFEEKMIIVNTVQELLEAFRQLNDLVD